MKTQKTGKLPWAGKMSSYSGNKSTQSAGKFSAKGSSTKSKHGGCGCGGKK